MEPISYHPLLQEGMRVVLVHDTHRQHQKTATVKRVLANASRAQTHQWYDVRFDDGTWGRFLERYLQLLSAEPELSDVQTRQTSVA